MRSRADIVFGPAMVAVFVDGCFWHGCPEHATAPKNNVEWWRQKIDTNQQRDARVTEQLSTAGWTVVRVWEHEDMERKAAEIEAVVRTHR